MPSWLVYGADVWASLPCDLEHLQKKNNKYKWISPKQITKKEIIKHKFNKQLTPNKKTILFYWFQKM